MDSYPVSKTRKVFFFLRTSFSATAETSTLIVPGP